MKLFSSAPCPDVEAPLPEGSISEAICDRIQKNDHLFASGLAVERALHDLTTVNDILHSIQPSMVPMFVPVVVRLSQGQMLSIDT